MIKVVDIWISLNKTLGEGYFQGEGYFLERVEQRIRKVIWKDGEGIFILYTEYFFLPSGYTAFL